MMKNKKFITAAIVLVLIGAVFVIAQRRSDAPKTGKAEEKRASENDIEHWTCSMHPQVKQSGPGQCPICGMNLIPVKKSDKGKIIVDDQKKNYLGIRSVPAGYHHLVKTLRLPGRISHDYELYTLQQEYLSVLAGLKAVEESTSRQVSERQKVLVDAVRLRLKLLGLDKEQITRLEKSPAPDESLISPVHDKAWVLADVYEQNISLVRPGQKVAVKVAGYDKEFTGAIYSVEDVLNPQTRSAKVRIEMDDAGNHLKHEAFADVLLRINIGHQHLSVPVESVIDTGTRKVVYVETEDGRFEFREVKTGVEAGDMIEIIEGLTQGEKVVVNGNFLLDSQTTLTGGQSLLYSGSESVNEKPQQEHRH